MSYRPHAFRASALASAILLPALLAACGGGDGANNNVQTVPVIPPPVATTSLVVKGTAATGAAMAGASVKVSCAKGASVTSTASTVGAFSATITDGALPCVLTATSADGKTELHSIAAGTSSGNANATANITPLSELLIAHLAGKDPKDFITGFSAGTAINAADVISAQAALLATLRAAGLDTTAVADIIAGTLTAGTGAGYDGVLDKLGAMLAAASVSLPDLTAAVSGSAKIGIDTNRAAVGTVLARAATDCPSLKAGPLRLIDLTGGTSQLMTVDPAKLTVSNSAITYTLSKVAACDYAVTNLSNTRVLVSKSGVAMFVLGTGKTGFVGVAFPEQKLDVAALAGTYNTFTYSNVAAGGFGDTVFGVDGKNGLAHNCTTISDCATDATPKGGLVANTSGGFDYANDPRGAQARVFAYRNAAGKPLMVALNSDKSVTILTKQEALVLPTLNRIADYWQFNVNSQGVFAISTDSNTVTSADATTNKVTRIFGSDSHIDTITFNSPFTGMRYRNGADCIAAPGKFISCNSSVQLPFGGLQLSISAEPTKAVFMTVVVEKP